MKLGGMSLAGLWVGAYILSYGLLMLAIWSLWHEGK